VMPSGVARWLPSRFALIGGIAVGMLAAGLAGVVLLIDPSADAHHKPISTTAIFTAPTSSPHAPASSSHAPASSSHAPASSSHAQHGAIAARTSVAEARDPEESRSFPAPASVHHSAAKEPQAAGEAVVAPGAASDSEVRSELARMKRLESAAHQPSKMATVPGGNSIVGNDGAIPISSA
jgi:hypothetical protein